MQPQRLKAMLWRVKQHCLFSHVSITCRKTSHNHMIIFNDSISNFYQWNIWGFCQDISMSSVSAKYLESLKKYVSESKIYFCSRKKSNDSLNRKVNFVFRATFKLDLITQIIYCIIHRWLCFHFIFFCSLISVSKKWNKETMLAFPYSYNCQKFNNKMNEKRSHEYQIIDTEYVTGQINSCIQELLSRRFCCLIFPSSRKS